MDNILTKVSFSTFLDGEILLQHKGWGKDMKKIAFSKKLLMTTVSATVLMNSQVLAEDSDSMDEIIVTAQKREQSILDIPFAISALMRRRSRPEERWTLKTCSTRSPDSL